MHPKSVRTTNSTRRQSASRRKLLLETLESRQLLAVDGLGLAGDSLTDEYINEPYGQYAQNWVSLVGQYRSGELPLGEYRPTTISPPDSFEAPWGDLRRAGYEYNWALAGANSFTLLDPTPVPPHLPNPIGQHILLAEAINAGDISHAVLAIGQNDFSPNSAAYAGIYDGSWDFATIQAYSDNVLSNIVQALNTINVNDVKLVMSNIIDYGVAPETQSRYPDPFDRSRVSFQIEALNDRIEARARQHRVPIIDSSRFAKDLLGSDSFTFGGVKIFNDPGQAPNNAFVHDGIHPHTITSSLIANSFMNAVNVFYGEQLTLFTEEEVLGFIPELTYTSDTFALDYNQYLLLPGPDIPPELLLHSNPNSNFKIFLDFDGNVNTGTPWNSPDDPYLIDEPSSIILAGIRLVWQIVAEDFAPFDVDVTTEEPGSEALRKSGPDDTEWGVRVVIMDSDIHNLCFESCGGLGGIGSFDASIDTPVYTFSSFIFSAANTSSHEVGHSLTLGHHGNGDEEYYPGHDGGTGFQWNAIMGGGSSRLSNWSDGSYFDTSNPGQDDLAIITTENGFGYRVDDHQEELEFATPLRITNSNQVSFSGIIERSDDIDAFTVVHGGGPLLLEVRPFETSPNLDVWAGLYDEDGELIYQPLQLFDPFFPESPSTQVPEASPGLSVLIDQPFLAAGTYFLKVDGVGSHGLYDARRDTVWDPGETPALPPFGEEPEFVDPWTEGTDDEPPVGYSDYGSLGQYWITGSIVPPTTNTINIEATDAIKPEGNSGDETNFVFTLTRTGPLDGATNVDYIVIPALPRNRGDNYPHTVNAQDFRSFGFPLGLPSGFATFEAGEATTEIAITVSADTEYEPDEYFEVLLFEAVGESVPWTFQNNSAIGVIKSDENQFFIKAPGVDVIFQEEGDDLGTSIVGGRYDFTVYRNGYVGADDAEITVPWSVDSSAFANSNVFLPASPSDFVTQDGDLFRDAGGNRIFPFGEVVFAPGETEKVVTLYAKADRIFEMDEGFHLALGNPEYSTTVNPGRPLSVHPDLRRSQGYIQNEDIVAAPTLTVQAEIAEIYENGEILVAVQEGDVAIATRVTITRDGDILNNPVVVTVSLSPESADEAFLMIGPPVGVIDPARDGLKSINIPFGANQEFFDNLYVVSVDDNVLDGTQVATILATADDHITGVGTVIVHDRATALDRYIAKPDDSYRYEWVDTIDAVGYTTYIIDMTSQTWRDATEVDKPVWQHWVQIIVPDNVVSETAVLVIGGGSSRETAPTQADPQAIFFALQTGQVTVLLPTVPSQPLIFSDDLGNPRSEDEIIAYSYDKFLDGGDDEWPALLPMVKSAVRAMDTAQDFLADNTDQNIDIDIEDFFVTGASKRGWTTWLTAAVDDRVSGIGPAVFDVLNMNVSMNNHRENYEGVTQAIVGGYARAVQDYTGFGIFDRFDTPEGRALSRIVDPYQYRERYVDIPKYIVNSTGDQFFTPDSSLWYFDDLPGEKYLWYVPNTAHGLNAEAVTGIATFVAAQDAGIALPEISWDFEGEGKNTLRVNSDIRPTAVRLWQATRTDSIDFRQETDAPPYTSTILVPTIDGDYVGTVPIPTTGGTAFFIELTYVINGQVLKFTTQASIAEPPSPTLVSVHPGVQPFQDSDLSLSGLNVLQFAPQDLTFQFNSGLQLASNLSGIQIFASGGDNSFGNGNDIRVIPASIGIQPDGFTVVATFAQPLPEERYRIVITGRDDLSNGIVGLRNFNGEAFKAGDGTSTEVIDFDVNVILDFGDAPASYGTLLANNGARHAVQPWQLPRLGSTVDTEANGQPGNQDDLNGVDDEDGISTGTYTVNGNSYEVFTRPGTDPSNVSTDDIIGFLNPLDSAGAMASVQVFGGGFLSIWVDFDQNGTLDADELVVNGLAVSGDETTGTRTLVNIRTPSDAQNGSTWMRVRISDAPIVTPVGLAIGGEVEDYPVDVISIQPLLPDDDSYTIDEDITLDTLALGRLPIADGDTINDGSFGSISFALDQPPQHGSIVIDPTTGHFVYQPNADFNGVDTFTYRLGSSLATPIGTVTINVNPINDAPEFDIDAPLDGGVATLTILESDDPAGVAFPGFAFNIEPGPLTALDEQATQQVSFTILESSGPDGLMAAPPQLSPDGRLFIFPVANAVGSATYLAIAEDAEPGNSTFVPRQATKEFTIHIQPVNDVPRAEIFGVSETLNADEAYSVGGTDIDGDQLIDPIITYTLREDNIQDGGAAAPFFIPLIGASTAGYDRIGLLDVFNVGPANEQDASPGGSQSLELVAAGIGSGPLTNPRTTDRGGTLTAVFVGGTLTGFNYVPPIDFNTDSGGLDSFRYEIRDDGVSYNLNSGELEADPKSRTNRVQFQLNAVNDAPVFTTTTTEIVIQEDSGEVAYENYAIGIGGGPLGSAFDENDIQTLEALVFTLTPENFDAADIGKIFSSPPSIDPDTGELRFRTQANVFGTYIFQVRLVDNGNSDPVRGDVNTSAPQLLTINVLPVNDPPTVDASAPELEYTLREDGSIEILVNGAAGVPGLLDAFAPGPLTPFADEAADVTPGGNQTVSLGTPIPTTTTQGGTLQLLTTGGPARLLYTPRPNFSGIDSFVYVVTDDGVSVELSGAEFADPRIAGNTVTLNVTPVNDAPIFSVSAVVNSIEDAGPTTHEAWATNVQAGPISATDEISGPNAQSLSFNFVQTGGNPDLILPGSLVATIDPVTKLASLSYEAAPNQNGTAVFEVTLIDDGPSDPINGDQKVSAPKTFTLNVAAVNDPPSFSFVSNDPVTVVEDRGPFSTILLENISPGPADESGQTVSFVVQPLAPEFAALFSSLPTIDAAGVLRFTTAPNRNTDNVFGPVPVRIIARDSEGGQTGSFGFRIVVTEVNDRPVANPNSFDSDEDTILTISVASLLANDVDPDLQSNANETLTIRLPQQSLTSSGASLSYNEQNGQITYDPRTAASIQSLAPGQTRTDSFTYSLVDATGLVSNTVTVSIQIQGINDAPMLAIDTPQLEPSGSTIIRVLDNDTDIDGAIDPSSVVIGSVPAFGTVSVTPEGVIVYSPFGDFTGVDTFSYTVADNLGLRSAAATVTISANASPIVRNDAAGTFLGEPIRIDVAANDEDSDGLDLSSVVIVTQPLSGQAISQSDGTVLYVPNFEFTGNDSFTYRISDTLGRASGIATVTTQVVASRLQNPVDSADVNADGHVTAIDALLIINHLNRLGNVSEVPVVDSDRGPNYYDVSGDQVISAVDALRVVNALRLQSVQPEAPAVTVAGELLPLVTADRNAASSDDPTSTAASPIQVPTAKIVDVASPSNAFQQLIDTLAQRQKTDAEDQGEITAAIDAAMADLL